MGAATIEAVKSDDMGRFATTRWSIVRAAAGGVADADGHRALATLFEAYWRPVYLYCRREGLSPSDAEDASQEFHAQLLSGRDLSAANPAKGRFRSYLLTCLKHFLSNRRRDAAAEKRGGGRPNLSLDAEAVEVWHLQQQTDLDPERSFERAWALTLLERVMAQLREDYEGQRRGEIFAALKPILVDGCASAPYSEIAARLDTSSGAIRVAVHKLRQRYGDLLRREIADTVTTPDEVEAEIRELFAALG